jgi:hypothetical protein
MSTTTYRRLGALAAAGGLVVGLTAAAGAPARAADATTTYECTVPGLGAASLPVSVTPPPIPSGVPAGLSVPAGLVGSTVVVTVPKGMATKLTALGVDGGRSPDFGFPIGPAPITVPNLATTSIVTNPDGTMTMTAKGKNGAFTTPAPGTYDVTMPAAFTFVATKQGADLASMSCSSAAPSVVGSVTFVKSTSTTSAKGVKIDKGRKAKIKVTVSAGSEAATGVVSAVLDGKKKLPQIALKRGKATYKIKGLKVGKHKLVVTYAGDAYTQGSRATARIKVVKPE